MKIRQINLVRTLPYFQWERNKVVTVLQTPKSLNLGRLVAQFLKYLGRLEAFRQRAQKTNAFHPTAWPMAGFKIQDCGYPGILTSLVTNVRLPHYDPREGGQIAKKWSENDPLVVGVGEGGGDKII